MSKQAEFIRNAVTPDTASGSPAFRANFCAMWIV